MYYVYILLCSDNSFYTGIAKNPQKRFLQHQQGLGGAYTCSHPPLKIVYLEKYPNKSSALKRESQIKKLTHSQKIHLANLTPSFR